jgi:hypothetical protein
LGCENWNAGLVFLLLILFDKELREARKTILDFFFLDESQFSIGTHEL